MNQKAKDTIMSGLVYGSSFLTVAVLILILGFIFINGIPNISMHFLTSDYEDKTMYVNIPVTDEKNTVQNPAASLGISVKLDEEGQVIIDKIESDSSVKKAVDMSGEYCKLKKGDIISKIDSVDLEEVLESKDEQQIFSTFSDSLNQAQNQTVRLKITRLGGGIIPMLVTTLYMILLSLLVAAPIGILSAIYLNEYAKQGKIVTIIRFAIQNLSGIPSIIYGLFGSIFFVQICKMSYSILAGALTIAIILLPVMISTTEEALKAIPRGYRESSLGLGATKLQTISKIILPNALPGILVAVILSIGRIVGESAALLLTAGTVASIPTALTGSKASGATLTIKAYTALKEQGNIGEACAIGVVLIMLIIVLNLLSKMLTTRYTAKQQ